MLAAAVLARQGPAGSLGGLGSRPLLGPAGVGLEAPLLGPLAVDHLLLGAQHRVPVQVGVHVGAPLLAGGVGRELSGGLEDQGPVPGAAVGELLGAGHAGGAGVQAEPVVARRVGAAGLLRQALDQQPGDRIGHQGAAALGMQAVP
ncbi:hypothetical protein [Kitasatospora sp. NPDC008115]|uniref:hypothetical protein n=1 Tax=Kitasatospora sp. NPDC008115 TaxID=3364022 RepID=UPI0036E69290